MMRPQKRYFMSSITALLLPYIVLHLDSNNNNVFAKELPYNYYDNLRNSIPASNVTELKGDGDGKIMHLVDHEGDTLRFCHVPMFFEYTGTEEMSDGDESGDIIVTNRDSYAASAGALLAIHHFNNGISSVVPDLANVHENCNIRLTTEIFDTEYSHHKALRDLLNMTLKRDSQLAMPKPCAVLGSSSKKINDKLTTITEQYDLFQVSPFVTEFDELDTVNFPRFIRTNPTDFSWIEWAMDYLTDDLQVKYLGILHDDTKEGENIGKQIERLQRDINKSATKSKHMCGGKEVTDDLVVEKVRISLSKRGWNNETEESLRRDIANRFTKNPTARSGYKYFMGYFKPEHFERVMKICYEEGILVNQNVTNYNDGASPFWLFRYTPPSITDQNIASAINGSVVIQYEGARGAAKEIFEKEWEVVNGGMSDYIHSKQPHLATKDNAFVKLNRDAFYSYDAMVGMGLAACGFRNKDNVPHGGHGGHTGGPPGGHGGGRPGGNGGGRPGGDGGGRPGGDGGGRPGGDGGHTGSRPGGYGGQTGGRPGGYGSQSGGRPGGYGGQVGGTEGISPRSPGSKSGSDYISGTEHLRNFVDANFTGATGNVLISRKRLAREGKTVPFSVSVVEMSNGSVYLDEIEYYEASTGVVRRSREDEKKPPRDRPVVNEKKNHMPLEIRVVGLTMCAICIATSIGFFVFTFARRNHRIVIMSQPTFLRMVALGTLIFSSSIIPLSIDDGIADTKSCHIACNAKIWCACIGFTTIFSALFSKLWRIMRLVSSERRVTRSSVGAADVMGPFAILMCLNLIVLIVQTSLHPVKWVRGNESCDDYHQLIESEGFCDYSDFLPYGVSLFVLNATALISAMVAAYKVRNMSSELQESKYIAVATIVVFETVLFLVPIVLLVKNVRDVSFLVTSTSVFIISMAVLLLIYVPKIRAMKHSKQFVSKRNLFSSVRFSSVASIRSLRNSKLFSRSMLPSLRSSNQ